MYADDTVIICTGKDVKDRQQEVGPVLVSARYNGDFYIPNGVIYMYYIYFISLFYGRFVDMKACKNHMD